MVSMKTQIQRMFKSIFENLDVILGCVCALCGTGIFYLSLIGRINQLLIGITLIVSALMYLVLRSRLKETIFQNIHLFSKKKEILTIIFFVLIIVSSVLWYNQVYSRPFIYFLVVSFLAGIISIEILLFTKEDNAWPILFKIFFMTFVIRMGIYYNFPSIMGIDAYFHTNMANIISTTGIVPPFEISEKYVHYPIFHIFIAITKIVSFITIKDAVFFSIGIMSIACTLFLFIFVNRYAGPRVGLLSTLIFCITTQIIVTGITNITPGSLVLCYFLILICLLIDRERHPHTLLLCLIIMFTIVITHQLSSFVALISLCLLAFGLLVFEHAFMTENKKISFKLFLALFGITMIFYWIYTPLYYQNISFFEGVLAPFIDFLTLGGTYGNDLLITGHDYVRPYYETLILQISYLILPFFGIAGIFFWLSRRDEIKFSIAFTSGVLFFIIYAFPLLGSRDLLTDRWMPFLFIFLGIVAAAYILSGVELIKSITLKIVTIFVILTLLSFFMITPPEINKDNPLVAKNQTVRNQFKYSEVQAAETISQIHGKWLITDSSYQSLFFPGKEYYVVGFESEDHLLEDAKEPNSLIILRKSTLIEPVPLKASTLYGDFYDDNLSKTSFEYFETAKNRNLVFTNGNIIGYQSNIVE